MELSSTRDALKYLGLLPPDNQQNNLGLLPPNDQQNNIETLSRLMIGLPLYPLRLISGLPLYAGCKGPFYLSSIVNSAKRPGICAEIKTFDNEQNRKVSWSPNSQGVTHDDDYWYFSNEDSITKVKKEITHDNNNPKIIRTWGKKGPAVNVLNIVKDLQTLGNIPATSFSALVKYPHLGAIDLFYDKKYQMNKIVAPIEGYLVTPTEPSYHLPQNIPPLICVFDTNLNSLNSFFLEKYYNNDYLSNCGWCAVNPINGLLYTSSDNTCSDSGELIIYNFDDNALDSKKDDAFISQSGIPCAKYTGKLTMWKENANGQPEPFKIINIQGGAFSKNGHLYVIGDYNRRTETTKTPDLPLKIEDCGLFCINAFSGKVMETIKLGERTYKDDIVWEGWDMDFEPEGITVWDLGEEVGQLHVVKANNNLRQDEFTFFHFKTLWPENV